MATLLEQAITLRDKRLQERQKESLLQQAIALRESRVEPEQEIFTEQETTEIANEIPQLIAGEEPSFIGRIIDKAQEFITEKTGLLAPDIGFIKDLGRPEGIQETLSELKTQLPSAALRIFADRTSGLTGNILDIIANKVDKSILDSEAPVHTFGELVDKISGLERTGELEKATVLTGKIFNFTGRLKTFRRFVPTPAAAPLREGLTFLLTSTDEQIVKAITDDPTFEGGSAVARDTTLGFIFGLGEAGLGAAFKFFRGLKPEQQAAALRTLKLKVGATEAEIRKAAQKLAIKFHPDKVAGKVEQFKKVIRARDVAIAAREGKVIQKVTRRGLQITGEDGKPAITPKAAPTRPPAIAKEKIQVVKKPVPAKPLEAKQEVAEKPLSEQISDLKALQAKGEITVPELLNRINQLGVKPSPAKQEAVGKVLEGHTDAIQPTERIGDITLEERGKADVIGVSDYMRSRGIPEKEIGKTLFEMKTGISYEEALKNNADLKVKTIVNLPVVRYEHEHGISYGNLNAFGVAKPTTDERKLGKVESIELLDQDDADALNAAGFFKIYFYKDNAPRVISFKRRKSIKDSLGKGLRSWYGSAASMSKKAFLAMIERGVDDSGGHLLDSGRKSPIIKGSFSFNVSIKRSGYKDAGHFWQVVNNKKLEVPARGRQLELELQAQPTPTEQAVTEPQKQVEIEKGIPLARAEQLTGQKQPTAFQIREAFGKMTKKEQSIVVKNVEAELQELQTEKSNLLKQRKEAFVPDKPLFTQKIKDATALIKSKETRLEKLKQVSVPEKPLTDKDLQKVQAVKNRAQATGQTKRVDGKDVVPDEDVSVVENPDVLGAGNTVPKIDASLRPKGKPVAARDIIFQMERDFGVPFRSRITHMMRKSIGHFQIKSKVIRQRDVRDLSTAVHELGHHLDHNFFKLIHKHPPEGAAQELLDMGKELYGKRVPPGGYKSEGVAEYIRNWMTDNDAETKAPNFTKWFNKYLKDNPEVAKRLNRTRELIEKWKAQGAVSRIESQIVKGDVVGTIGERIEGAIRKLDTLLLDKFSPLRRLRDEIGANQFKPTEDPFEVATANATKAGAKASFFALKGTTDLAGNITGPSLQEVMAPVSRRYNEWQTWAVAAKARQLHSLGINPGISKTDADFVFEQFKSPEFEKALVGFTKWNQSGLDYMAEAGAIEQSLVDGIKKKHTIYVPMKRAFKEGEIQRKFVPGRGFVETASPLKRIKGSGRAIKEILQEALKGMEAMISTAQKSQVALAMANLADRFPGAGKHIVRIPAPMVPTSFSAEQIKGDIIKIAVQRLGVDPTEVNIAQVIDNWDEDLTVFTKGFKFTGKENVISIVRDGKRLFYEVSPDLFNTLKGLDKFTLPWYLDFWMGKANRALRLGATGLNPEFAIRNFLRDLQTFGFTTEFAKGNFLSGIKGVGKDIQTGVSDVAEKFGITIPKDKDVLKFQSLGGELSSFVLQDKSGVKHLKSTVLASDGTKFIINTFRHPIDVVRELVGITEVGTRIGEFSPALKEGERRFGKDTADAAMFALNAAQDVTVNFSKSGTLFQILNQVIPFSNVAVQGPLKLIKTMRKNPIRSIRRGIIGLTLTSVWLWWINKDKKWWKNLPVHERGNYMHFENPKNPNEIFRFPVAFELGHFFQTIPVAALDAMYRDDPDKVKDLLKFSLEQANPLDWPAAIGPIIDVKENKDFAGRPIVPRGVEGRLPEDRFKPHTSQLMRFLGKKLKMSPAELEFMVNSYSGGMYGRISRLLGSSADGREGSKSDLPVIGTLFLRDPFAPKKQIEDFYTRFDLLSQKNQSDKITRDEKREFLIRNKIARAISPQWKRLANAKSVNQRKEIYGKIENAIIKGDKAINR